MRYDVLPELAGYGSRLNAAAILLETQLKAERAAAPALIFDDKVWSYADLDGHVNQIANLLVNDFDLVPGNRVLLRAGNSPWLAAAWFAALKAGAIPIATMPVLRERELVYVLDKAQVQLAICASDLRAELNLAAQEARSLRHTLLFGGDSSDGLEARANAHSSQFQAVDTAADDVAIIGFTSGSTGTPKATVHFHRDLLAAADCFAGRVVGMRPDDRVCGSPQIAFLYGLCAFLVDTPRFGAAAVLVERATPEVLLQTIERYRATVCFSTPSGYARMLETAGQFELSSLRVCVAGGEPLAPAVFNAWRDLTGVKLINGLGISELLHIFISARGEAIRPGAIGRAVPGFEVRVVDESMRDVAAGEVGQMIVKGPNGCRYLDDDARQAAYVHDGWNLSGDLCRIDADGYFYYDARTDDMIVTSGYNVAGPEVEAVLLEHEAVRECAVVAAPDPLRGQLVKAFVIVAAGVCSNDLLATALQEFVKARLAPFKYPRVVEFVPDLPRTATGKIRRGVLRELEQSRTDGSAKPNAHP